jgi:hypothetical protein
VQIGGAQLKTKCYIKSEPVETNDGVDYEVYFKSKGSDIWGIDSQTIEHEKEHLRLQDSSDNVSNFIASVPKFDGDKTKQEQYLEEKIKNKYEPEYLKKVKEMHNRWDKKDGSTGPTFEDVGGYYDYDPNKENKNKVKFAPIPIPTLRVPAPNKE